MVIETTTYARVWDNEALGWLQMLDYEQVVQEILGLRQEPWDYLSDMEDARVDVVYIAKCQRHLFLRFIVLDE